MPRVLVLRPGAIGDSLLTIPALAALGAGYPMAAVHLVGNAAAAPLIVMANVAERWTAFDEPAVTGLFVPNGPGAAGALGPIVAAVAWCADPGGVLRTNLGRLGAEPVVVAPSRPPSGDRHVADHLIDTLEPLGVRQDRPRIGVRFQFPPPLARTAAEHLDQAGLGDRPWIAVHPGSGSPVKNWPATALARLIVRLPATLGLTPVLLAGPADDDTLGTLLAALPSAPALLRNVPLPELAAILPRAVAYVGNDSGPTHLAAMLGLPTVALFGPTDPVLWAPRGPRVRVIRSQPLEELPAERVLDEIRELLGRDRARTPTPSPAPSSGQG